MPNYYFTFGYGQYDGSRRYKYVKIDAPTYGEAREEMVRRHGLVWAFQYNEKEFLPQIEQFGLSELK